MAKMIDAEPIKKFIADGLNNPDPMKAFGHDAIEILAEIEYAPTIDALPLRCHMGDTVWIVGTKCLSGLYESECGSTEHGCYDCPLDQEYIVFRRTVYGTLFIAIHELEYSILFRWGETVFKTQEEAEAALAKMKEADDENS